MTRGTGKRPSESELEQWIRATEPARFNDDGVTERRAVEQVRHKLLADLKPVQQISSPTVFAVLFFAIFGLLLFLSVCVMNPLGWAAMMPFQRAAIFTTLAGSAGLLAYTLSHRMIPGARSLAPVPVLLGVFVLLCLVAAALFQGRAENNFVKNGEICLGVGFPFAALGAVVFSYVLSRGANLSPYWSGAVTGMLAGLVSTSALEIHCPNFNLWHILFFHVSFPLLGLGVGVLAVWMHRARA